MRLNVKVQPGGSTPSTQTAPTASASDQLSAALAAALSGAPAVPHPAATTVPHPPGHTLTPASVPHVTAPHTMTASSAPPSTLATPAVPPPAVGLPELAAALQAAMQGGSKRISKPNKRFSIGIDVFPSFLSPLSCNGTRIRIRGTTNGIA